MALISLSETIPYSAGNKNREYTAISRKLRDLVVNVVSA
jgi:hypothetical protein